MHQNGIVICNEMHYSLRLKRVRVGDDEDLPPNKRTKCRICYSNKAHTKCGIALAMFVVYAQHLCVKNASICNRTIFLGAFMQERIRGDQLTHLAVGVKLDKNTQFFY